MPTRRCGSRAVWTRHGGSSPSTVRLARQHVQTRFWPLTYAPAVIQKPHTPIDIQVRNVTRFSYGELRNGSYVVWAQGKAGWFEFQPAAHYKAVFDGMIRAVEILYFVTDIYHEPRKRGAGPSAQLIFKEVRAQSEARRAGAMPTDWT